MKVPFIQIRGKSVKTGSTVHQRAVDWQSRAHFFAVASHLMRRILVDHARGQAAEKRGGGARHVALDDVAVVSREPNENLVALDEALERLAALDPQQALIVEVRFFGGLTIDEAAAVQASHRRRSSESGHGEGVAVSGADEPVSAALEGAGARSDPSVYDDPGPTQ